MHKGPGTNESYLELLRYTSTIGWRVESRIGMTRELLSITFGAPMGAIPRRKKMNLAIGWSEMLQLIGGDYRPEVLERVAPKSDLALFTKNMAYGLRTRDQIPLLLDELRRFPESRRAVLHVGNAKDQIDLLPCTNSMQFLVRQGALIMLVSMRSWDLIKGLPYDMMMFGGFGLAVAQALGVEPGAVHVTAGSGHIYASDFDKIPDEPMEDWSFNFKVQHGTNFWPNIEAWARNQSTVLRHGDVPEPVKLVKGASA